MGNFLLAYVNSDIESSDLFNIYEKEILDRKENTMPE